MSSRGNPHTAFEGQSIDDMIAEFMAAHDVPGMSLAIVQAPYISRAAGYGVARPSQRLLASPRTLWDIGEMIEAYIAVAILQLVEARRLTLDDPLDRHLPDQPPGVTLRQLLGHIPGGARYQRDPQNFALLARVVEAVSGMTCEQYIRIHQIERLGLRRTLFASEVPQLNVEAVEKNEMRHKLFLSDNAYVNPAEVAGDAVRPGALLASAEDISHWDIGLAGGLLVADPAHRAFIYSPTALAPANCGWRFYGHKGLMDIQGHAPGFSCYLSRFTDPSELVCVTLCANREGLDLTELARRIAGAFDRRLGPPASTPAVRYRESSHSVATTVDRLAAFLQSKGVGMPARIDHAAAAASKGLELRPTQVLIFGDPALGTSLMAECPEIARELPIRVAVWEAEDRTVWLSHPDLAALARAYGITREQEMVGRIARAVVGATSLACAP